MTKLQKLPSDLPVELLARFSGCDVYDSSSSPEARVYFADADGGCFIKVSKRGTLRKEALLTEYFHLLGLGAEVICSVSGEKDVLVTKKIRGRDLTDRRYLDEPRRLASRMGELLRELHERDVSDCPVKNRTAEYLESFEEGYRIGRFDPSYIDKSLNIRDADTARDYVLKKRHLLCTEALIHGDFCLPNVIFDGWELSGYIDLGAAGVGDRHIDLFWGAWTLNFNLGTNEYRNVFFNAYGRELVDEEKLLLISAIEAFG